MSVGDYLLLVGSTCATGASYCADVVRLMPDNPDAADWPLDRLIGQYADPSTGEMPCLIRVTSDVEAPQVSHRLLVRESDLPERAMGLVRVVSEGPVPWDLGDGKPPVRLPISRQLEFRDEMFKGHHDAAQVLKRAREYVEEYESRIVPAKQSLRGTPRPRVPKPHSLAYRRWFVIWRRVQPQVDKATPVPSIHAWLTKTHPKLVRRCKEDTLGDIIRAGLAGELAVGKALER